MKFFAAIKTNKAVLYVLIWKCLQDVPLNEKRCRIVCIGYDHLCMLEEAQIFPE